MSGVIAYLYRMAGKGSKSKSEEDPGVIVGRILEQYVEILELQEQAAQLLPEAAKISLKTLTPSDRQMYEERKRLKKAIADIQAIKTKAWWDNTSVKDPQTLEFRLMMLKENLQATPQQHAEALRASLLRKSLVMGREIRQNISENLVPALNRDLEKLAKQTGLQFSDDATPMEKAAELIGHLASAKDEKPTRGKSEDASEEGTSQETNDSNGSKHSSPRNS